mmetsp:Transcript_10813/g.10433  ORF Transcript_10813/g.10433 Transcript_10813/m.10433 type:complete len:102 (-) Transcript_10813:189-494(-)
MSDTCYASVSKNRKNVDIIDEQWMSDCLSDDEIDMPKDMEENDDEDEEESSPKSPDEIWTDCGLEIFAGDQITHQAAAATPQPQSQQQQQQPQQQTQGQSQ